MERKRQNASHIRNLILLAIRDNNFDEKTNLFLKHTNGL